MLTRGDDHSREKRSFLYVWSHMFFIYSIYLKNIWLRARTRAVGDAIPIRCFSTYYAFSLCLTAVGVGCRLLGDRVDRGKEWVVDYSDRCTGMVCFVCSQSFATPDDLDAHGGNLEEEFGCTPPWEMDLLNWTRANCGCWLSPVARVNGADPDEDVPDDDCSLCLESGCDGFCDGNM